VMMSAPRPPQQDDQLVRERQDRLLQRMPFFFHGHAPVVWHPLRTAERRVRWHH